MGHTALHVVERIRGLLAAERDAALNDVELLGRFTASADAAAFEAIVRRHGPMVLAVCRRVLANSADADDAFQATFAILVQKAASLSRPERLAGWLFQVAYKTARRARSLQLRLQARREPLTEVAVEAPIAEVVWRELRTMIDEELDRLPEKLRLPVVYCFLQGRSKRAAARLLGWPEGTFSCRLQQARERLRARLVSRGVTLSAGALSLALIHDAAAASAPSLLIAATIRSASLVAKGAALPGPMAALTQGVIHSMSMTKMKIAAALVAAVIVVGGGSGWLFLGSENSPGRALAEQPASQAKSKEVAGAAWRGAGQEFRIEAVPGTESQRYTTSYVLRVEDFSDELVEAEAALAELTAAREAITYYQQNVKIEKDAGSSAAAIIAAQASLAKAVAEKTSKEWTVIRASRKALEKAEQLLQVKLDRLTVLRNAVAVTKKEEQSKDKEVIASLEAEMMILRAQAVRARSILENSIGLNAAKRPDQRLPIDAVHAAADLRQCKADAKAVEAKLQEKLKETARLKRLREAGAVDRRTYEKAEGEAELALAEVKQAQAAVERARVVVNLMNKALLSDAPSKEMPSQDAAVTEAQAKWKRLKQQRANGDVADADVDKARIALSEARIASELRSLVEARQKELERAKKLLEVKAITPEELQQVAAALAAAERQAANWKKDK
jgi:RNA polymerase sigma factor (sigma-70 family)